MRLILFFSIFTLLYGSLHLYVLWTARRAYPFGRRLNRISGLFIFIMLAAPFGVRQLEKWGYEWAALKLAWVGYTWMGFLFLLVCAALVVDDYRLGLRVAGVLLKRDFSSWAPDPHRAFFAVLLCAAGIFLYGYLEALGIRTVHLRIGTPKISAEAGSVRIVQISDVHLGLIVREGRLRRILEEVRKAEPDILVSTGDLVDGQMDNLRTLSGMLRQVPAKYGKFAVTGNHEAYAGMDKALAFLEEAGFILLRGDSRNILPGLSIAGVDDPAGYGYGMTRPVSEREVLRGIPRENFKLLLKHRPFVDSTGASHFDLQLSGHTHKGQIFPFTLLIKLMYPVDAGLLALPEGGWLYVSRGTGTWGPPIRFLAPPEVTLIELFHQPS